MERSESSQQQVWAWPVGILLGLVIGVSTLGGLGGVGFGIAIGIAFALAFGANGGGTRKAADGADGATGLGAPGAAGNEPGSPDETR
ncbi:hypothetical protein [Micromonospora sp. URMC 103]|uniref:hypothetical protein n=1 Tax=Micromonospora sp. URMC 103 TaxID=3423406 RepID=UPI003F1C8217